MRFSTYSRSSRASILLVVGSIGVFAPLNSLAARAQDAPAQAVAGTPATAVAGPNTDSWTTFKGDAQRTGASNALVSLPLSLNWRYSSDGPTGPVLSAPLVLGAPGKQRLYSIVGSQILCLDAQNGSIPDGWKTPQLASSATAPLTLLSTDDGDFVVAATQGGQVSAYSAADGRQAWQIDLQNGIADAGPIVIQTAQGTRVVVALGDGNLVALTPQGIRDTKWRVSLGQYGNPPSSAMALSPNGSLLYIIASDGKLYGIETKIGRVAWAASLSSQTGVVPVVAGNVVVTAGFDRIAAFNAQGGASKWSVPSRGVVSASPAFRTSLGVPAIYYGNDKGDFYSLDARDGKQNWKTSLGVDITSAPVALENMVVVGLSNGLLVAMNPRTGAVLWQYRLKTEKIIGTTGGGRGRGATGAGATNSDLGGARFQQVQGGGFGGGGFGGRGRRGGIAAPTQQFSKPYGISAAPSVVNGQLFVQADDATVYAFTSQLIDADPPRVVEPSIDVNDTAGNLAALLVGGTSAPSVPGRGPFYFAATLDDVGSGVDPQSIKVSLDGKLLKPDVVDFDASSGVLTVTLLDGANGGANFPDGPKNLSLSVSDYAGNNLAASFSFSIDNTAPAPSPPSASPRGGGQGGAVPGGGGFGGIPGGFGGNTPGGDPNNDQNPRGGNPGAPDAG